jgi:hypothetical protein
VSSHPGSHRRGLAHTRATEISTTLRSVRREEKPLTAETVRGLEEQGADPKIIEVAREMLDEQGDDDDDSDLERQGRAAVQSQNLKYEAGGCPGAKDCRIHRPHGSAAPRMRAFGHLGRRLYWSAARPGPSVAGAASCSAGTALSQLGQG